MTSKDKEVEELAILLLKHKESGDIITLADFDKQSDRVKKFFIDLATILIRQYGYRKQRTPEWPEPIEDEFTGDKDNAIFQKCKGMWNQCRVACIKAYEQSNAK